MRHRRRRGRVAARVALVCAVALSGPGVHASAAVPGERGADEPAPRRAVERLARLASDPLVAVAALPRTGLESEEPERLYALVTRDRPVEPLDYAPDDLEPLPGGFYEARAEVARQAAALVRAAQEEGHVLAVTSGFRDHATQAGTYQDWVRQVGPARADQVSARAGHSEHQLGLAIDLAGSCSYQCFGTTEEGRWVAEHAHRWGFLVRYPEGGQEVTGYAPEAWHLRYVGPRAAWAMHLRGEPYWERFADVALEAATAGR